MKIYRESYLEQIKAEPRLEEFQQIYGDIWFGAAYGYLPVGNAGFVNATLATEEIASNYWATPPVHVGVFTAKEEARLEEFQQIYGDIGLGAAYGYLPIGNAGFLSVCRNEDVSKPCKSLVPTGRMFSLEDFAAMSVPASLPPPPPATDGTALTPRIRPTRFRRIAIW